MSTSDALCPVRRRGRPPDWTHEIVMRIIELRLQGLSYGAISTVLNSERIPTPAGRPVWARSYVDRLLHTRYVMELWEAVISRG